ncbi:MAG: class I SAM-dependent methyltransferase [Pseudomonadota bacterium]
MSKSLSGYRAQAAQLAAQYDKIPVATLYQGFGPFCPKAGETVLDIGAGTCRDAAHWQSLGAKVVAVEPVRELWQHDVDEQLLDHLPNLPATRTLNQQFDVIIINAVWHHLPLDDRQTAASQVATLLAPQGRLLLALRHGPTPIDRPGYPVTADIESARFAGLGLTAIHQDHAGSIQPNNQSLGVTWTRLVLQHSTI